MTVRIYIENSHGEKITVGSRITWMGKVVNHHKEPKNGFFATKGKGLRTGIVIEICQKIYRKEYSPSGYYPVSKYTGEIKNRIMVQPDSDSKYPESPIRLADLTNIRLDTQELAL